MKKVFSIVFLLVILLILLGCRTKETVIKSSVSHDTVYLTQWHYDSIFSSDSSIERYIPATIHYDTLIHAFIKTDTLFRDHQKLEYRYKLLRDTMYISRVDTIPKVVTMTKTEQVRYVPWGFKLFAIIGLIASVVLIAALAFYLHKRFSPAS